MKAILMFCILMLSILGIHAQYTPPDAAEIEQKALEKARELGDLLKIIGNKRNDRNIRQNAKDMAMDMFDSDTNQIEVISKLTQTKRKYNIRDYLNHLESLEQYEDVKIEWKYIQTIEEIHQKPDGFWYGKLRIFQIFEGVAAGQSTRYKDITEKDIEIKLNDQNINTGQKKMEKYFDLKFGNVAVYRLIDESDSKP
ncbi:MAG: hypothetical protein IPO62_04655 [Saprospiraceae bacterium]|nr:hypothetical protein [Saprospiraceae bacterium]